MRAFVLTLLLLALAAASQAQAPREPVLAGSWYPADPAQLRQTVDAFLEEAAAKPRAVLPARPVAILAPHAGYAYSGRIAAQAWSAAAKGGHRTVVLVGPSHRMAFTGVSVWDRGPFKTPLGEVPLDEELVAALRDGELVRSLPEAHVREHSLEIQVPFVQRTLPGARIVPLVMGGQDLETSLRLGQRLAEAAKGRPVLLAASSDLSHFHPDLEARAMDALAARRVTEMDPAGLARDLAAGRCEACGGGPLVAVMAAARILGARQGVILAQGDSGDVTGDRGSVVGYLAAAFVPPSAAEADKERRLSDQERETLRRIARQSVAKALGLGPGPDGKGLTPLLAAPGAAFVTLKRHGELRGCIGRIEARDPLHETVARMARAAAFEDPRFPPLAPAEFHDLQVEISVLTPFRKTAPEEVTVGRDGLMVRRGGRAGLLLPQVPLEWGWGRTEFLEQTCRKAGLPPDCWKDPDTEIQRFSAEVF